MNTLAKIRIGISKKPVERESKTAYKQIEHRTLEIDQLVELIQSGHALGAICAGDHVYENFIGRQDIQLDIDASDFGNHALHYYVRHEFFTQYGYIGYNTRTPGHCRLFFRLSKQITNPVLYARYADVLVKMFGADHAAVSCVQLWYTYAGCDVAINGKVLPVALLDKLVNMADDSEDYQPPMVLADPETLLQQAIDSPDGRNNAGYNLALCLRCLNMSKEVAQRYLERYQAAVCNRGTHPYTMGEAKNSLDSAYRRRKTFEMKAITDARIAIVSGEVDLSVNVRKTAYAILAAMEQVGRTISVELGIRQIARAVDEHAKVMTVHDHIDILKSAGLFRVHSNGKGRRTAYTLVSHSLTRVFRTHQTGMEGGEDGPLQSPSCLMCTKSASDNSNEEGEAVATAALDYEAVARSFEGWQRSAATESHAKIHPKLQTLSSDELVRLGPGFQAILSVLEAAPDNTVDSLETLRELARLSWRVTSRSVQSMQLCGLVEVVKSHRKKAVRLIPGHSERISEVEPVLITYGRNILRSKRSLDQKQAFHTWIADNADSVDVRYVHDEIAQRAQAERAVMEIQHEAAMQERREAATRLGLDPATVPNISEFGESRRKRQQPIVDVVDGKPVTRPLIPDESKVTEKGNRKTQRELEKATSTQTVIRHYGGDPNDPIFDTTEVVEVVVPKHQRLNRFVLTPDMEAKQLWL